MSSGDIALLIIEIIGGLIAGGIALAILLGLWVNATWGTGR